MLNTQGEVGNLRSNELLDLQSRMGAAMQRIAELETALQRSNGTAGSRPAGNDDTRAVIRDNKFRRTPRISPHNSARSPGSDPSAFAGSASDNVKMRTRQVRCAHWLRLRAMVCCSSFANCVDVHAFKASSSCTSAAGPSPALQSAACPMYVNLNQFCSFSSVVDICGTN